MSFGKDYRLVGEATVTGEKYRAGKDFWSTLAHTDIIGRIRLMVEHYAIVGEHIDKPLVYDRVELIAWLASRTSNCLACYNYYLPPEDGWEYDTRKRQPAKDPRRFTLEFISKMKEVGLSWKEFQLYYSLSDWARSGGSAATVVHSDGSRSSDFWPTEENIHPDAREKALFSESACITPERFVAILDEIATNRQRLAGLPAVR
jgi:hypothetical protein